MAVVFRLGQPRHDVDVPVPRERGEGVVRPALVATAILAWRPGRDEEEARTGHDLMV